ncbi:MAG TPA: hypothetical protein DEB31_11380 [Clostridiales bacterium]|nr:hypothetical protein [Clostridiales bacterium]
MNGQKSAIRKLWPYLLILCAAFYALPFPSLFSNGNNADYLITTLLIINPAMCFVLQMVYSLNHGFCWYLPLLGGGLFVPAIFIFYNHTAALYTISYIVISYIGAGVGYSFFRNKDRKNNTD